MTHTHTPELEAVSGGWLRAARHSLGLSVPQLATILDVRPDTLRQLWEHGTAPIPDEIRTRVNKLVEFTDAAVDSLRLRAETIAQPAIVVYHRREDLPEGHIAHTYGLDWWDRVAFSVARLVPDLMIGHNWEVAAAYDYTVGHFEAVHADPSVIALYAHTTAPFAGARVA